MNGAISPDDPFLTLYFDIQKGSAVSVTTLGRSLLEFEKLAREVSARSDPFLHFDLQFEGTEEGSLRILTSLKEHVTPERLKWVARQIIVALVINTGLTLVAEDTIKPYLQEVGLVGEDVSDEDVERIAREVVAALQDEEVKRARNSFYQAIEADPAVKGVGVVPDHARIKPTVVVPREEFSAMAIPEAGEVKADAVPRDEPISATLLVEKPVLRKASKAKWVFRLNGQPIMARVEDADFLESALSGQQDIPLVEGVELDVILVDHQEFKNGVWVHKSYTVRKVIAWRSSRRQPSLPSFDSSQK